MKWKSKDIFFISILSILAIACFPVNPLVLAGVIKTEFYLPLFITGCIICAAGIALIMAPIIMFPKYGGAPKGKSFVDTTRLVDTGIYGIVRHPQYLGGILAIFVTCLFWNPHWLFAIPGFAGAITVYFGAAAEEKTLEEKFGEAYKQYKKKVPRIDILTGIWRVMRNRRA